MADPLSCTGERCGSLKALSCKLFLGLALALLPLAAMAHGGSPPADTTGLPIAAVSHGEMAVIAGYRSRILDMAGRATVTDPKFRTLQNYTAIQHAICFWLVMPGAIHDEQSPFNECAHADLAAALALLLHMRGMPALAAEASELVSDIERDVILTGGDLIGCQYSGEAYNTAEFVFPAWGQVSAHLPTMLVAFAALLTLLGAAFLPCRRPADRRN